MATFPSIEKAKVDKGVPPFLNAQVTRGAVLKKTVSYKAGSSQTAAGSYIQDIPLPEGCLIELSSISITHDGAGAGNVELSIGIVDNNGGLNVNSEFFTNTKFAELTLTSAANEIVRNTKIINSAPSLLLDPYQFVLDKCLSRLGIPGVTADNPKELKQKYRFCLMMKNVADITANKTISVSFDCIIP